MRLPSKHTLNFSTFDQKLMRNTDTVVSDSDLVEKIVNKDEKKLQPSKTEEMRLFYPEVEHDVMVKLSFHRDMRVRG